MYVYVRAETRVLVDIVYNTKAVPCGRIARTSTASAMCSEASERVIAD